MSSSGWSSGYYVNPCGCPHLGYIHSYDKHSHATRKLLNFMHKLLHRSRTTQQMIDEENDNDMWDDGGGDV